MAKTFDRSIQNGAICICFFVKWQLLLRVTFQAYKSSTIPRQHHTLKSWTVWMLSLLVRCRTNRKTRPFPRKIPQKYNRSWKIFVFRRHYLSSRVTEVAKISEIWPKSIIETANCRPCCFLSWSSHHRLPKTQDACKCTLTIFLRTPSDRTNS